jgi:tetratricopeptide (TPR) repeat protein
LSKEPAALAVVVMAAMAFALPGRRENLPKLKIAVLVPHLVFALAYAILRGLAVGGAVGSSDIIPGLLGRLAGNVIVIPQYLGLVLFPSDLNIMHSLSAPATGDMPWLLPAWGAIFIAVWLLLRSRSVPVLIGLLWFALNYLPISNIVPIPSTPMAERYLYLPAVGLWVIAADRGYEFYGKLHRSKALVVAAAVVLLLLGGVTVQRNRDWKNDIALFGSVVRTAPVSTFGHFNLGNSLRDVGDLEGARREWQETLRLDPSHSGAMTQLGSLAAVKGDLGKAERWFQAALDADPANAMARFNLALVLEKTGRPDAAAAQYDLFLRDVPLEYREYIPRAEENRARLRKGRE